MSSSLPPRPSSAHVDEGLFLFDTCPPCARPIGSVFDMFKDGADPEEISMSDVLCDFCGNEWKEEVPMIEGHQGSCICGKCLKMAWQQVVVNRMNDTHEDWTCRMCLEKRDEPCYRSPLEETAHICRRCIRMGAHALQSDDPGSWDLPRRSHRD